MALVKAWILVGRLMFKTIFAAMDLLQRPSSSSGWMGMIK